MSYTTSRPKALEETPEGWEKLPYHVAIVPVDRNEVDPVQVDRKGAELSYQFDAGSEATGGDAVTTSLSEVLAENVFNRVSVLTAPSATQLQQFEQGGLDAYWMAAAREAKADLLLDVDAFTYPSTPKSSGLLQSYFLFFAGPLELMFPDRKYSFDDMSLAVSLYDVGQLAHRSADFRAGSVAALNGLAEAGANAGVETAIGQEWESAKDFRLAEGGVVRQFRLQPDDLDVRFGDRYGRGPGSPGFWTTLVVPSAFLQRDSETFGAKLSTDATLALARDLARDIFEGDSEFIVNPQSSPDSLQLDVTNVALMPSALLGDDVLEFRAPYKRPASALGRSSVRVGAFDFPIAMFDDAAPVAADIRKEIDSGFAVAVVSPEAAPGSRLPAQLIIYVPTDVINLTPASYEEAAPVDVLQLTLIEDLASRGDVPQSWTFELEAALGEDQVTLIREASFKGKEATPIEASAKRTSLERQ